MEPRHLTRRRPAAGHTIPTRTALLPGALALVAALALAGCGDDDETDASVDTAGATVATQPAPPTEPTAATTTAATTTAASTDAGDFCTLAAEINGQEAFPTLEQVEAYVDAAPAEIRDQATVVLDLMRAADGDLTAVFADPTGSEALAEVTAFEAEQCGLEPPVEEAGPPQDPSVTELDPDATRIDLTAVDYGFEGPLPTAAGRHSLVMTNAGEEPHIMILVRIEEGSTLEDALASEGEEGVAEMYESDVAAPGGEAVLTADIVPGSWALLCPIPDSTGTPHFASGMIHEFEIS